MSSPGCPWPCASLKDFPRAVLCCRDDELAWDYRPRVVDLGILGYLFSMKVLTAYCPPILLNIASTILKPCSSICLLTESWARADSAGFYADLCTSSSDVFINFSNLFVVISAACENSSSVAFGRAICCDCVTCPAGPLSFELFLMLPISFPLDVLDIVTSFSPCLVRLL